MPKQRETKHCTSRQAVGIKSWNSTATSRHTLPLPHRGRWHPESRQTVGTNADTPFMKPSSCGWFGSGSGAPECTHKRCAQQTSSLNKRTFRIADKLIGNNCNSTSGVASRGLPPMQREALLCLEASRPNPSNRGRTFTITDLAQRHW